MRRWTIRSTRRRWRWLNCSVRMVRQYAEEGLVIRIGPGRFDLERSIGNVVLHLRELASSRRGADGSDVVKASAALKDARRQLAELRHTQLDAQVISLPEAEMLWADLVRSARRLFQSHPAQARAALSRLSDADQSILEKVAKPCCARSRSKARPARPSEGAPLSQRGWRRRAEMTCLPPPRVTRCRASWSLVPIRSNYNDSPRFSGCDPIATKSQRRSEAQKWHASRTGFRTLPVVGPARMQMRHSRKPRRAPGKRRPPGGQIRPSQSKRNGLGFLGLVHPYRDFSMGCGFDPASGMTSSLWVFGADHSFNQPVDFLKTWTYIQPHG